MFTEHGIRLLVHAHPVRNGSDLLVVPSVDGVIVQQIGQVLGTVQIVDGSQLQLGRLKEILKAARRIRLIR